VESMRGEEAQTRTATKRCNMKAKIHM